MFVPGFGKRAGGQRSTCQHTQPWRSRPFPLAEGVEPRYLFAADASRDVIDLEPDWLFHRGDVKGASAVTFDDSTWSQVNLPHTWNAKDGQDGGDNFWRGIGWYRKSYDVPADAAGRELFLKFAGASLVTEVFVNGESIGEHEGGFSAFTFDVTGKLHPGASNVIAVKVDNSNHDDVAPISGPDVLHTGPDHTLFGGIYRGVNLVVTDPVHVTLADYSGPGVYVKQDQVSHEQAQFEVTTKVENDAAQSRDVTIVTDLLAADGSVVQRLTDTRSASGGGGMVQFCQDVILANPHLWDGTRDPYLYEVVVRVQSSDGTTLDEVRQPLGLRYYSIDPQQGFFLNGERYDLHGVNLHQDRLDKGWAVSPEDVEQDISLVKEIGATFVRLVHYPHDQETYDLLDRAGIVVWSEIPYNFEGTNSVEFNRNVVTQLREMIRQNFNHPSVFFWGLANAVDSTSHSNLLVQKLNDVARAEDPSRTTVLGTPVRVPQSAPLLRRTGIVAMNSYAGWYNGSFDDFGDWVDSYHEKYPDRAMGVAEAGAGASVRQHAYNPDKPQSDGPNHPEEYQSKFHEAHWRQAEARPWLWVYSVFNMFDFASDDRDEGDTPGRNDKGLITYDRKTKKDSFYFYKANWSDEPTVYITSRRWTRRDSRDIEEIKLYSNAASVEVKVNGRSLGSMTPDDIDRIRFRNVRLDSGTNVIEAIATMADGTKVGDSVVWTAGSADRPNGMLGTYYQGTNFTSPVFSRIDPQVNFDWGASSPGTTLSTSAFSVRWTGRVLTDAAGTYTFNLLAGNQARVYVDGQLLIDAANSAGPVAHTATISLAKATRYDIVVEYVRTAAAPLSPVRLSWVEPGEAEETIPAEDLRPM